ncbi:hypothetical protein [Clostridium estertheticum]|uniref:hypothetical protein n=1 Tax=Clostridium estertheticum TaxID=238834 RepID=UPI001C7CE577|nr:hypothetical protein [Clostridium estertheticum]MBX4267518.1 hypothetical protein [Clostridium estertheticum]WLC91337.1 hypothetical protein KTC95_24185 [Clostridium estertheticum]
MIVTAWFLIGLIGCIWASTDAVNRGNSGCLVFLLILLGGPVGLIIWLLIRPEK